MGDGQAISTAKAARWPRPETVLLLISLVGTLGAKAVIIRRQRSEHAVADLLAAGLPDVLFIAAVAVLLAVLLAAWRSKWAARTALATAIVIGAWSLSNAGWLLATGVQLQPSVLEVVAFDPAESWGVITVYAERNAHRLFLLSVLLATLAAGAIWFLLRPRPVPADRRRLARRATPWAVALGLSAIGLVVAPGGSRASSWSQAIGFNSHWYALAQAVTDVTNPPPVGPSRTVPHAGERTVLSPPPDAPRPNVVVIFLESVSHKVCSLGDPGRDTTPTLARLAAEGIEFRGTRLPVPLTSKAWWSAFTGTTPEMNLDTVEAVLVDTPYEGLIPILARNGYRSAFFQMSTGTWSGTPALFSNLGFDWGWFRENLEDESGHLGWMNGDDLRMLEPMFEWVDGGDEPFLLSMITSISHEPYDLPSWYPREPAPDPYGRYLQTIECADMFVDAVLAELDERSLLDNTLVCVIGDHGESFRPESKRARWAPLEEVIRIPWVVWWPGHVEPGQRIPGPTSQMDMTPTLLSILGYDVTEAGFDGRDATLPANPDRRLYFASWYRNSPVGYIQGTRKYIYWPYTNTLFEYDLDTDPGEQAPTEIHGAAKDAAVADMMAWTRSTYQVFPARRFREARVFDHWQVLSQGRTTNVYYIPRRDDEP